MSDNPMVTLNRAIAVAMVQGPAAGLALVDASPRADSWPEAIGSTRCAGTCSKLAGIVMPP
jgi:predicted RNA polymerase sigma factor